MIVTLNSSFVICNGTDLTLPVMDTETLSLTQDTQVAQYVRASWPTFFHSRASQTIPLVYPVTYPPCATVEAAVLQSRQILAQCPKGGVLTEQSGSTLITYADAKLDGIDVMRRGLTNLFTFKLTATDPDTATLSTLAAMDARYVFNFSAITGLTGGGSTKLDGFITADVTVGCSALITPVIGGLTIPKTFRLIAGTTAENTDPSAGPLVVRPDDYNGSTNAKIWVDVSL